MGFKLIVTFDSAILQPQTVTRGTVTQSGMINDSIGAGQAGKLLIVWSDTDAVKEDGTLVVLTFKALQQKNTALTVSYSQSDTFDGGFNDVTLNCKPVEIRFGGKGTLSTPATKQPDNRDVIAAVESVEDKTDVSAVNEAIARLTGTEDLYSSPEEVQSAYRAAVADNFVGTVLLAVDGEIVDAAIQNALQEVGAETIQDISPDKQTVFVQSVETALRETAQDVPSISDTLSAHEAVQTIKTLQTQNEEARASGGSMPSTITEKRHSHIFIFCCVGAAVLIVTTFSLYVVYRGRKNKEEQQNDKQ